MGRYGLTIDDINNVVEASIGGMKLTTTIEGRQRFSVNARYAQEYRNSIGELKKNSKRSAKQWSLVLFIRSRC
jgi:Cu(I)/Ag(I) efflux system membrane protein CusA/SilA